MRFHRLDLNLLVALDALLRRRNVTRAAQALCLTQSGLSGSLARLREHFKDELVVPAKGGMVLTPLAESIAGPLHELLLQTELLITTRPSFDPLTSERRFTLMGSDYVTKILLLDVVRRFVDRAPKATVMLEDYSETTRQEFERGEIEMIVVPSQFAFEDHPQEVVFEERYVCVVWKDNDQVGNTLTMDQYLSLRHVIRQTREPGQSFEEWFLTRYGHIRRVAAVTPSFALVPELVIGTDLVATVHERLAKRLMATGQLRIVELPIEVPTLTEVLQWHSHLEQEPGITWFRGLVREAAEALAPSSARRAVTQPVFARA